MAELIGAIIGHGLLLSILYTGSGSSDRPLLRSATFNTFIIVLVFFLAGAGRGSGSQLNFEHWEMNALAGLAVAILDHFRLRGKHGLKRTSRTPAIEAAHRAGILWTAISAASFFAFIIAVMLIDGNTPSSSIGSIFTGLSVVALITCLVAYPVCRLVAWSKATSV